MRALKAKDLAVDRGQRRVVQPLNAVLEPGTITAICGPNGAGKSSLLMALAGLLNCAQGEALLGEEPLQALPAKTRAKAIGYLPQSGDVAWNVAVESLVALGRHPHGDAKGESGARAVQAALEATQMAEFARRPIHQLSGGEKARALLARALAGEPEWILADEPLAALDLAHQLNLIAQLKERARAGQGVVIVLHDLALAMNHADRALVLKDGALVADGSPEDALASDEIAKVWGIKARWIGDRGARALALEA